MARIKLELPKNLRFSTKIKVRISDINYGNHLSNDAYLSMIHEARMQFFQSFNYSEKNLGGVAVIMGDVAIVYKKECYYGEELSIEVDAGDLGARSFDLYYRFIKEDNSIACEAKTGMVCYDYTAAKTVAIPDDVRKLFTGEKLS